MISWAVMKWGLTGLSITGALLVGPCKQPCAGNLVWVFANAGWVAAWSAQGERQGAALFTAYLTISLIGFLRWRRP